MSECPTTRQFVQRSPGGASSVGDASRGLRLIAMGAGPFAVPLFRELLASPHQVTLLVTRPDRPVHGKQVGPRNLMRATAQEFHLPVFEPESINSAEAHARLTAEAADLFVVCDFGQILSTETLGLSRRGGINLHGSLLPKYRGAAPIQWALYHGETETGVSVIHMTSRLDAGPVLVQRRLAIDPIETAGQLEDRLAALGGSAVLEAIAKLTAGHTIGIPQDSALASRAPRLKKTDGLVNWRRTASEIHNQIRAMHPWPKAFTTWQSPAGSEVRLILESAAVLPSETIVPAGAPGTVTVADGRKCIVACAVGSISVERIQPAGKRVLSAEEFIHGYRIQSGHMFR